MVIYCTDSEKDKNKKIEINPDVNGYIWGNTTENNCIAIYVGEKFYIYNNRIVNTWNYIISKYPMKKEEMMGFTSIRFYNGVIQSVFSCEALEEKIEMEEQLYKQCGEDLFVYGLKNDSISFDFSDNISSGKWKYYSVVKKQIGNNASLNNTNVCLEISFEKKRTFKTFYNYYGYVSAVHSFLVFRKNISFERVVLCEIMDGNYQSEIADCYVKQPEIIDNRDFYHAIYVSMVNKDVFERIIKNAISNDNKTEYLPSNNIPETEKEVLYVTGEKIWMLCSSLEKEMELAKIHLSKESELNSLIIQVKEIVKKHRGSDSALPPKTYDCIFNSISHWNDSLSDRIEKACEENSVELEFLLSKNGIKKEYIDINKLVMKRNKITHEGFNEIDDQDCYTYYFLKGLLYCLALKRMGFNSEKIINVMSRRFIG